MQKVVVSASSLPAGRNMSSQIEYLQRVGNFGADMYHLDVMDGVYVKAKSIDYTYFEQLKEKSALLFDVHLMIANPEKQINKYIKSKAEILTVHYETFSDDDSLIKTLKKIRKNKKMVGLAIDIDTEIEVIEKFLKYIDTAVILCVKVGKGGQEFNIKALDKIKQLRSLSSDILIEADGGINAETAKQCVKVGADILVSGNFIYTNDTYEAIRQLKGKNG